MTKISQNSRETNLSYNTTSGFLQSVTNPLSQTTGFIYNSAGRLTAMTLPDSRVISYSYDSNGNITSITPPGRPAHYFNFNSQELLSSYAPPTLTGVSVVNTTHAYNSDKQLTQISKPSGDTIEYQYNSTTGVLENIVIASGTIALSRNSSNGLVSSIADPSGVTTSITYTGLKETGYSVSDSVGGIYGSYSGTLGPSGLSSDTVSDSLGTSTISYAYNDDEDLTSSGDMVISYNTPDGQMTGTTMGTGSSGFSDSYTYNNYGEVTGYQAQRGTTTIYSLTLTRDGMGRISDKTQAMNGTTDTYAYTFDSTGRLTQTNKNSTTVATYSYDDNSNRNGGVINSQTTSATFDNQDRLVTYNTLSFTYNANGDLSSKTNNTLSQTTLYVYDVFGNLKQVTLPNSDVITYEIDGLNRRIGKRLNGNLQKRWVYMDQYRIAAELDASGMMTKRFIYGSKKNIPDYVEVPGDKYRIISDHLGSPRLVIKQSDGSIVQRMDHDEFGRVTVDTNPGYLPFGFAGGLYDSQTGLVRFGARDYDPETGRWTSKDPILFGGGQANLYGYSFNDPVNFIDPDGKNPLLIIAGPALAGAISSGVTTYLMTGSRSQAVDAAITGGIAGAFAGVGAIGAIIGGGSSVVAGIVGAGVDLGITIANAPGGLPDGGIADFANGIGRIMNPPDPDKMCK